MAKFLEKLGIFRRKEVAERTEDAPTEWDALREERGEENTTSWDDLKEEKFAGDRLVGSEMGGGYL